LKTIIALVLACIAAPAAALEFLTEENRPLNFSENGKPAGIATGVVAEMAKRAGVDAAIRVLAWSDAFDRALKGDDACVYSTARTAARLGQFQWIGPIARGEYSAFALAGFSETPRRVDDLKQYRIGAVEDARAEYLRSRGFPKVFIMATDAEIPKHLTVGGRNPHGVDLWITQTESGPAVAEKAGVKVKMVFSGILTQDYWLACGKKFPAETAGKLSEALAAMGKDGSLRKLQTRN
jgi:polar amino acid transport system substrate-binding protein